MVDFFGGHPVENNTWTCGYMKFISSVDQDISRVNEGNEGDIYFILFIY